MRAIVFDGERLIEVDDLVVRDPGPGEVRVRMLASGICQSDLHVVDGQGSRTPPVVLGHEGAAEVVGLGPDVEGIEVGDRVVIATLTPCRTCRACLAGRPTDCPAAFGTGERPFTLGDTTAARFANASTWAEEVVVRSDQLHRFGDLSPSGAALLGCAMSTGYGNVVNVAEVRPGDDVVVIGLGGIGMSVIQVARLVGAGRIVGIDVDPRRAELARRFGATDVVITSTDDPITAVLDLDGLVGAVFPFARWSEAIASSRRGDVVRSVIDFTA